MPLALTTAVHLRESHSYQTGPVNLLTNASKYTRDGGDIWFDIAVKHQAVITVRDSAKEFQICWESSLSCSFSLRQPSPGRRVEWGSVCHSPVFMKDRKKTIAAESDGPGKGSTFRIRLPLAERPDSLAPPAPRFMVQGCKLLLVEDTVDARAMLATTLELQGSM